MEELLKDGSFMSHFSSVCNSQDFSAWKRIWFSKLRRLFGAEKGDFFCEDISHKSTAVITSNASKEKTKEISEF
ncbi:unnamed protein product [Caenorhabditis nigoni]